MNSCRQTWESLLALYRLLPHEVPLIYESIRMPEHFHGPLFLLGPWILWSTLTPHYSLEEKKKRKEKDLQCLQRAFPISLVTF